MRILSHYFVSRFLGLFTTTLVAALLLLATVELVLSFDDLSSPGGASGSQEIGVLRFLALRLASYYVPDLLPITSFIASFIGFAWAGRAMELVAIQASGIRLSRVILPVLGTGLILSLATAILHETLILRADRAWKSHTSGSGEAIDYGRQAFWHHRGPTITNISKADSESRSLFGVEIFERGEDGRISRVIRAERVRIDDAGVWNIETADIWEFDTESPELPPRFSTHSSMTLDLDEIHGDALLGAEPALLSISDFAHYLDSNAATTSTNHRRLANHFHERLSQPLLVFLFTLLAVPFGLGVDRSGRIVLPALGATSVLGLFFLIRSAGSTLSREELLPVGLAPWLSIAVFAIGAAFHLRRASRSSR